MNTQTVVDTLKQVTQNVDDNRARKVTDRTFWMQAQATFKQASVDEKSIILRIMYEWASHHSLLTTPGLELFIPVVWESVVLRQECSAHAQLAFRLLRRLIAEHPDVQFAESLTPMLTTSVRFLWNQPLGETADDIDFVKAVIAQSRKESVSVEFAISTILNSLVETLSESDEDVWKRLLLIACLADALQPIRTRQPLPSWSTPVAKFVVQCLQSKRIMQSASCRYVIFELLTTLSRYTHNSLEWLRPLCAPDLTAKPLVVLLTTVTVEIQLGLNQALGLTSSHGDMMDRTAISIGPRDQNKQQKQLKFVPPAPTLNRIILENVSELLRLGLLDMKEANLSLDSDTSPTAPLTHLMTDDAAHGLWCQLLDVAGAMREYFQSKKRGAELSDNPEVLNAYLLSTYLTWLEVYYQTHHDAIIADTDDSVETKQRLTKLGDQLVNDGLSPVGTSLWSHLSSYFSRTGSSSKTVIERCLASLDLLSSLVPGRSILPYSFCSTSGSPSFGQLISDWLWCLWSDPEQSHSLWEVILNVLCTINNGWLGGINSSSESSTLRDLATWIKDKNSFTNRVIEAGLTRTTIDTCDLRLDLEVEILILCLLTVSLSLDDIMPTNRSCTPSGSVVTECSSLVDKVAVATKELLLALEQSTGDSVSNELPIKSLARRLRVALEQCAQLQPVFRQLLHCS